MKTYKIYFLALLMGLMGCEDILDKEPLSSVSEAKAFQKIEDVDAALIGVYSSISRGSSGYAHFLNLEIPTALSDNVVRIGNVKFSSNNIYDLSFAPVETVWQSDLIWNDFYTGIARANIVIRNIEGFGDGTQVERDNAKGEALALRGLLHFDLMRLYAPAYSEANRTALAVPYLKDISQDLVARNTMEEVFTYAIEDLEDAADLLDDTHTSWRISKSAVQAILSRVYLYKKEYSKVVSASNEVIKLGKNRLVTRDAYSDVWNDLDSEIDSEVIFRLRYTGAKNETASNGGIFFSGPSPFSPSGGYQFNPSPDLFALYNQSTDVRFSNLFEEDPAVPGTYGIVKYPGRAELAGHPMFPKKANDMKMIRMSEVYLNKAEALLKSGGSDSDILSTLNEIRSRRIEGFVSPNESGLALETAVYNERRKELAFEGLRFYDLKRWNRALVRSGEELLPANDYRFTFPLPYEELQRNTNLKQNTGY